MYFGGTQGCGKNNVLIKLKLDSKIAFGSIVYTIEAAILHIGMICNYTNLQIF